ncbi:translation initiation factor eIF2B subunit epsilon-like [Babylonia areolata]|uniref:translation initiation factor eIF2B subunit epsilon-like n=1 Tax=Babylonia areolata TaxID=304850 RepID=UPI003FD4CBEF
MAPKGKGRGDDLKQEDILQAVVVADSFNVRFGPVTEKKPRALLPLVNVPILDYTLDFLASQGVQETFIFCSHLSGDIRTHIKESRWGEERSTMTVKVVLAEGSSSMGDALREIHARSLVRNDFFLLNCDTIANVDLKQLMQEHRDRCKKIKSSVMTMTCMKLNPQDRMRCTEDNIFMAVDPVTQQIYDYQRVTLDKKIRIPLGEHQDMVLHQDLLDGQLYVCSPMVLHLFTDNFDYCTLDDFIRGIIINEEIFGNTVHVNVLKNKYCARITNPYMYDIISQDIISRKTQPISPKLIMVNNSDEDIECREKNIYLSRDVTLASSVDLKRNVVIGKGSTVQARTQIQDSIIGQNCSIGADVKLQNCYLWGSVTIEDGCQLSHAVLCDGVVVFAGTTVQPQTMLSWNVKVGPNIKLPPNIRLQDTPPKDEFADDSQEPVPDVTPEYGEKSRAFLYTGASEDADSDDDDSDKYNAEWGEPLITPTGSDEEDDDDDDEGASSIHASDLESEEEVDEYGNFYSELMATLSRAKEENINLDNLILEVNSLKHAFNIAIKEVHQAVVKVLVEVPLCAHSKAQGKELFTAVLRHVDTHRGLLKHYIKNKEAQWDCLHALEDFAVENERMLSVLSKVVQYLYDKDVLDERIIIAWHNTEAVEDEEEEHNKIRKQMEAFVTWLNEAEEESEDDDDDDD